MAENFFGEGGFLGDLLNPIAEGFGGFLNRATGAAENREKSFKDQIKLFNLQNEYNTPANQMRRLTEAGLSPGLMYGSGAAAGGGNTPGVPQPGGQGFSGAAGIGEILGAIPAIIQSMAQVDMIKNEASLKKQQAITEPVLRGKIDEEAFDKRMDAQYKWNMNYLGAARADYESILAHSDLARAHSRQTKAETRIYENPVYYSGRIAEPWGKIVMGLLGGALGGGMLKKFMGNNKPISPMGWRR